MTWINSLKRQPLPKVERGADEVVYLVDSLERLKETSKQLYKDGKKYTESMHEVSKSENQLTQELSLSPICHYNNELRVLMEEYHSVTTFSQDHCNDLILVLKKAFVEPMKMYNQMVNGMQSNIRKREQAMQECQKLQAKLDKLKSKDNTGPNVAKRAQTLKALEIAKKETVKIDNELKFELPRILSARFEYFQPCFETVILAMVLYSGNFSTLLNDLVRCPIVNKHKRDDVSKGFETNVQRQLAEIKALSIVADD